MCIVQIDWKDWILPVFAGMILLRLLFVICRSYSPRIRGDDPWIILFGSPLQSFSPYSRG